MAAPVTWPSSDPTGWAQFIDYNQRDIEVKLALHDRLSSFPILEAKWDAYALDQRINDTGILDHTLADAVVARGRPASCRHVGAGEGVDRVGEPELTDPVEGIAHNPRLRDVVLGEG